MAIQILQDCKLYVAGFDLAGDMNALALTYAAEMQDATTFGRSTRVNRGGLAAVTAQHEGLWRSNGTDAPDDVFFSRIGTENVPVTVCPTTGADGEGAFLFRAVHSEYAPGGSVGDLYAFSVSMAGSDGAPLVRATVLHPATAQTATGTGTIRQLGAVVAPQNVYGALHVIAASGAGRTLNVTVQSAAAAGFASPTARLTFAQQTAAGSDWQSAAGPVTDTFYRVAYTIGGTTPSFTFIVAVGIA